MKIEVENLKELMSTHLFNLPEEQLNELAFLLDIWIYRYKKNKNWVSFRMNHQFQTVLIEIDYCNLLFVTRVSKSGKVRFEKSMSFGGASSFIDAVKIFRGFFSKGYELKVRDSDKAKKLGIDQDSLTRLVIEANELVEPKKFNNND
jgi:hypothetical protein